MKETSTSAFPIFSNPAASRDVAAPRRAAAPESAGASAAAHSEAPSGGGAPHGRSIGYSDRVIRILCESIRQFGLSDSAAAVKAGMTATTLGQWKREFPEIALQLQQAREECRIRHLQVIIDHSQAENGRGWRAAAWLLERLFPGDYAPRARERSDHRSLEERTREREYSDAFYAGLRQEQAERDARFAKANQEYQEAMAAYEAEQAVATAAPAGTADAEMRATASEGALQNVKNSDAAAACPHGAPAQALRAAPESAVHDVKNSLGT